MRGGEGRYCNGDAKYCVTPDVDARSDEYETELTVWIASALASTGRHLPVATASWSGGRVPAGPAPDDAVTAASVAEAATHRHRLALDARHCAPDERPRPRSGRRCRMTAALHVQHLVLCAVSVQHINELYSFIYLFISWRRGSAVRMSVFWLADFLLIYA